MAIKPTRTPKAPARIPDALRNFDSLPDSAYVREPVVCALLSRSSTSIWRDAKEGRIPKPKKLGPRTTAWNVGELRAHLGKAAV